MKIHFLFSIFLLILKSYDVSCTLKKLVDLTWQFDNNTIYWTGVQPFLYTKRVENNDRGYW